MWGPSFKDFLPEGLFLGVTFEDWLKVLAATHERKITVLDLLEQFEKDHPLSYDYLAWKEHFGIMAEVGEMQGGSNG